MLVKCKRLLHSLHCDVLAGTWVRVCSRCYDCLLTWMRLEYMNIWNTGRKCRAKANGYIDVCWKQVWKNMQAAHQTLAVIQTLIFAIWFDHICKYVYMNIYIYLYIYIYIYIYMCINNIYWYVCVCVCVWVCVYSHEYEFIYTYVPIYIHPYLWKYMFIDAFIHMYIHIFKYS